MSKSQELYNKLKNAVGIASQFSNKQLLSGYLKASTFVTDRFTSDSITKIEQYVDKKKSYLDKYNISTTHLVAGVVILTIVKPAWVFFGALGYGTCYVKNNMYRTKIKKVE